MNALGSMGSQTRHSAVVVNSLGQTQRKITAAEDTTLIVPVAASRGAIRLASDFESCETGNNHAPIAMNAAQ